MGKSPHSYQLQNWLPLALQGLLGAPWIVQQHCALLFDGKIGITSVPPPQPVASAIERDGSWGHQIEVSTVALGSGTAWAFHDFSPMKPSASQWDQCSGAEPRCSSLLLI